jgi:hypothetical protein
MFAPYFQPEESWATWLTVVLPCLYGLPIDAKDLPIFQQATGRTQLFQSSSCPDLVEMYLGMKHS